LKQLKNKSDSQVYIGYAVHSQTATIFMDTSMQINTPL